MPTLDADSRELASSASGIGRLVMERVGTGDPRLLRADDLYEGRWGAAAFLAQLQQMNASADKRSVLERLRRDDDDSGTGHSPGGAFSGTGARVFGRLLVWAASGDRRLLAEASALMRALEHRVNIRADIVSGAAGLIRVALRLHTLTGDPRLLEQTVAWGDELIAMAIPLETGLGWTTVSSAPSTGFAHGAAGIGSTLLHLYHRVNHDRFRRAGFDALQFERSLIRADQTNRQQTNDGSTPNAPTICAWCYGAAGIGMSRWTLPRDCWGPEEQRDACLALAALHTTTYTNDCLCHGEFGRIELLLNAGVRFKRRSLIGEARRRALTMVRTREGDPQQWRVRVGREQRFSYGLMTGLSGIGYQLLRCVRPGAVPSILSVHPSILCG